MNKATSWLKWFFDPSGKLTRKEFWPSFLAVGPGSTLLVLVWLGSFGAGIPLLYIDYVPSGVDSAQNSARFLMASVLLFAVYLACAPLMMRRYRDAGCPPVLVIGAYVPILILIGFVNVEATFSLFGGVAYGLAIPGALVMVISPFITLSILLWRSKVKTD